MAICENIVNRGGIESTCNRYANVRTLVENKGKWGVKWFCYDCYFKQENLKRGGKAYEK